MRKVKNKAIFSFGVTPIILELAELVKIRYEFKFNTKCNLIIKSKLPEHEEEYNISLDRMKNTGYDLRGSSILQIQETIDH